MITNLILFLKILAWVFGILFTFLGVVSLILAVQYNFGEKGKIEQAFDIIQGVKRIYPFRLKIIIALVCWAFIFAF